MLNKTFKAKIEIIGINPFVFVPTTVLEQLFEDSGKTKGKIPVKLTIDGFEFSQTLLRYRGNWRLYLNTPMRKAAGKKVGDSAQFEVTFDPLERTIEMHPKLVCALKERAEANAVFENLTPSLKLEIIRYISHLKTEDSIDRNVKRAINFLLSKEHFIGRDHP